MNQVTHALSSADISIFTGNQQNQQILPSQEIQIQIAFDTLFLIISSLLESLKIVLTNMVTILIMSAKWLH